MDPKKPVYQFGTSIRDSLKTPRDDTPGPQYDIRQNFGEGVGSVSMNSKTKRTFNLSSNADVPGPGDYPNIPKEGHVSTEKRNISFSMARSKRFSEEKRSSSPGPGEHGTIDFQSSGPSFTIYPKLTEANRYFSKYLFKSKPIEVRNSEKVFEKDDFMYELEHYKPYATFGYGNRSDFTKKSYDKKTDDDDEPRMMAVPPPFKPLHGGFSFGNSSRNNVVVDTKDSEKVLYGIESPGPKYVPRYTQQDMKVHTAKMSSSDGSIKASRTKMKPGPGSYSPSVPGHEWIKKGKGAPLAGKEREVHDVFTNSTRKARFIQKQFGIYSPGPKYDVRKDIGQFGPSYSFPRAGNARLRKERKHAERRKKIFEAKDPNDSLASSEFGLDEYDDEGGREGGIEPDVQEGAENVYHPRFDLVEKRSTEIAFNRAPRMPKDGKSDIPGPKYYPGLTHLSQTRRVLVPRIVKAPDSYGGSKYRKSKNLLGGDSPGVARYYPKKSTLGKKGTSFGGIRPMRNYRVGRRRNSPKSKITRSSSSLSRSSGSNKSNKNQFSPGTPKSRESSRRGSKSRGSTKNPNSRSSSRSGGTSRVGSRGGSREAY